MWARSVTVNAGLRYDLQYLDDDRDGHEQCVAARRASPGRRPNRAARSCARAPAASTIACRCGRWRTRCLSADNTTDLTLLRQIGVSLSPTQTGAPVFPAILPAVVPTTTLVNLTHDGQASSERVFEPGRHRAGTAAHAHERRQRRISASPQRRLDHADQSERADVRRCPATTTAAGRTPPTPTTVSTHPPAARCTTDCTSRSCSAR